MTDHSNIDMKILALELVGEFSKTQETVDLLVERYFEKRTPAMIRYLKQRRAITNIIDQERPQLVSELAAELGTSADLSNFKLVFERVKKVRDYAGHSAHIQVLGPDELQFKKQFVTRVDRKQDPLMTITRAELIARITDARWLSQCVHYILATSDLIETTAVGDHKVELIEPTAAPEDWDGVQFKPVATWTPTGWEPLPLAT